LSHHDARNSVVALRHDVDVTLPVEREHHCGSNVRIVEWCQIPIDDQVVKDVRPTKFADRFGGLHGNLF
jgi:hypothetical protein